MRVKISLLLTFILFNQDISARCCLDFKNSGNKKITHFLLYSERCSGSNYLANLININTDLEEGNYTGISGGYKKTFKKYVFAHKHFPPWFSLDSTFWHGNSRAYNFNNTENYIIFVIVRNPYEWAQSFNRDPWHGSDSHPHASFSKFIRMSWVFNESFQKWNLFEEFKCLFGFKPFKWQLL